MAKDLHEPVSPDPELLDAKHVQLTPRQRQILELLKAGKVNKEIANELGIGLGTVKQHMVALFKRLNVRNRTMAVSQGMSNDVDVHHKDSDLLVVDGLLERRPCLVLSVVLPVVMPAEATQDLQQSLTTFALANDALLLMRKQNLLELIFGIQVCTEFDVYKAYHGAYKVYEILNRYLLADDTLRAALTGGMAIVSMQRHGGCTGEVIASPVIGLARELAQKASPGKLTIDLPAMALLQLALPGVGTMQAEMSLMQMQRMPWPDKRSALPALLGREEEMNALKARLTDSRQKSNPVCLIGETGMGKSLLCQHLAQWYEEQGGRVFYVVCQSKNLTPNLYQFPGGLAVEFDEVLQRFQHTNLTTPELLIVDDCQYLKTEMMEKLIRLSRLAKHQAVVLAGRRMPRAVLANLEMIKLGRLTDQMVNQIAAYYLAEADQPVCNEIVWQAQGVPLFAQLLAEHHARRDMHLPFALLVVIVARMDGLRLDRAVLAQLCRVAECCTVEALAQTLHESSQAVHSAVERAMVGGVLHENAQQQLRFTHPLLRQAVVESLVE